MMAHDGVNPSEGESIMARSSIPSLAHRAAGPMRRRVWGA